MTTVNYTLNIKNTSVSRNIEANTDPCRFGNRFANTKGLIYRDRTHTDVLSDGWIDSVALSEHSESSILAEKGKLSVDGLVVSTPLVGANSIPILDSLASEDFVELFSADTYLSMIPNIDWNGSCVIFKRKNGIVSLYKDFEFIDGMSSSISEDQYTVIRDGSDRYVAIGRDAPIPISEIKNSNISIGVADYATIETDYTVFTAAESLTDDEFADLCEKIDPNIIPGTSSVSTNIVLETSYFPITENIGVIKQSSAGTYTQIASSEYLVNQADGTVVVNAGEIDPSDDTVFVFYGTIPHIFFEQNSIIDVSEYIDYLSEPVSTYHISKDIKQTHSIYTDTQNVEIDIGEYSRKYNLLYSIPDTSEKIFVEPDSPMIINGTLVRPGEYQILDNKTGSIGLEFPISPAYLMQDASIVSNEVTMEYPGEDPLSIGVYGLFLRDGVYRASLMSAIIPDFVPTGDEQELYPVVAFSAPTGWYSATEPMATSNLLTDTAVHTHDDSLTTDFVFEVIPANTGMEFVMPAWVDPASITVYLKGSQVIEEVDSSLYSFIEPDILILSNRLDPSKTYSIRFTCTVYPLITNSLPDYDPGNDFLFDVIISTGVDLFTEYESLQSIHVVTTKNTTLSFGYIDQIGNKTYIDHTVNVLGRVNRQFFEKNISSLKSIIF